MKSGYVRAPRTPGPLDPSRRVTVVPPLAGEGPPAPLGGAMSAGVRGLDGQPLLSIAVKRKCDDVDEQFGPAPSTHHSTLPPGTLPMYSESVVTASSVAEPPLNAAKRRYD